MTDNIIKCFKCFYCSSFFTNEKEAEEHAKDCKFNEKNETCFTCKHHEDHGSPFYGSRPVCIQGVENFDQVEEDGLRCEFWEHDQIERYG